MRTNQTDKSNLGLISALSNVTNDTFVADFLENRQPPNPNLPTQAGTYKAFVDRRLGRKDRIELIDVPGATDIQIHVANQPSELEGCFAPGTSSGQIDWISNSGKAMDEILKIIRQDGTDNITVNIINNFPSP
jgi:hypothetical protein